MKKLTKTAALFLALILSLTALTGCGKLVSNIEAGKEAFESIQPDLSSAVEELSSALEEASEEISSAKESAAEELSSIAEAVSEDMSSAAEEISEEFSEEAEDISEHVSSAAEELSEGISDAVEEVSEAVSGSKAEDGKEEKKLDKNGSYYSKDEVALYIHQYGELPGNFITKKEAQKLGWEGGALEPYAPGKAIGGSYYGNYEEILPENEYRECDIDTKGKKRGAKRIVFSEDGYIYYTEDHYETFVLLYTPDGKAEKQKVYGGK